VGRNTVLGDGCLSFILIECHRFAAMRGVEERSLSSILRSALLTTLINNDVSGKVNASGGLDWDLRIGAFVRQELPTRIVPTQASSLVTKVD
jgi:hypothetical protein